MTEADRLNLINDLAAAIEQLSQALRRLGCISITAAQPGAL